jgi:hypothetical protein
MANNEIYHVDIENTGGIHEYLYALIVPGGKIYILPSVKQSHKKPLPLTQYDELIL